VCVKAINTLGISVALTCWFKIILCSAYFQTKNFQKKLGRKFILCPDLHVFNSLMQIRSKIFRIRYTAITCPASIPTSSSAPEVVVQNLHDKLQHITAWRLRDDFSLSSALFLQVIVQNVHNELPHITGWLTNGYNHRTQRSNFQFIYRRK
jgi:hypothetical protein